VRTAGLQHECSWLSQHQPILQMSNGDGMLHSSQHFGQYACCEKGTSKT
jgi:hypothetical protein